MAIKTDIKYNDVVIDSLISTGSINYDTAGKYFANDLTIEFIGSDDATASAADILAGQTAYIADGTKTTGTISSKAAETITPTTSNQTILSGQYLAGDQTILGDANLIAANIAKDVTIFGITGTHSGGIDPSDATATAADIVSGKTAYIAGGKTTGTLAVYDYSYTTS